MSRISRSRRRSGSGSRGSQWLGAVLIVLALALLVPAAVLVYLWPRCSGDDCPSMDQLRNYEPPQASRVLDRSGGLIAHLAPERRIVVPLERIPDRVSGAFLAVEDKRFFDHDGIDYRRAVGALVRDVQSLSFEQGFSTITMQLARNVFPEHLTREKTLRRKLWEIVLAREIERAFSKSQILEMYLNQIYLGNGLYGIEAAAQGYFGKSASELSPAEAATLAALPKAPSTYDPRRNPEAAIQRRNLVLFLMATAGVITRDEASEGRLQPLDLVPPIEASGDAPYLVAAVRKNLRELFGADAENAGLRVYTGLDRALQRAGKEALQNQLAAIEADGYGNFQGASCSGDGEIEDPEACLQGMFVAVDVQSGDVLALVGGRDFGLSQFDRATQARRQAGSAFKPFVYATALAQGIPISTQLGPTEQGDLETGYRPADHVSDTVSLNLREGLRLSSNRAAVTLGERVGVSRVVRTARNMGISTPMEEFPSTFLGAADVIPLELVAAYTAFANNGIVVEPRLIRRVEDAEGRVLYEGRVRQRRVLPASVAFLTTDLMRDVVDHGTGYRVREAGLPYTVPAAGKTGTTNQAADAWFVGITPDLAAGVWVGFDRPRRIMHGAGGGNLAAPVWGRALAEYYESRPNPAPWIAPIDLLSVTIDRETGMRATEACPAENVVEEWFIPSTEPRDYCPLHPEPGISGWFERRVRDLNDWFGGTRVEPNPVRLPEDSLFDDGHR
jgi:penicillin-binding protein 1A